MAIDFKNYIDQTRKELAYCLNHLETVHRKIDFTLAENPNWDTDVRCKIEEAAGKLGFALAELTTWFGD